MVPLDTMDHFTEDNELGVLLGDGIYDLPSNRRRRHVTDRTRPTWKRCSVVATVATVAFAAGVLCSDMFKKPISLSDDESKQTIYQQLGIKPYSVSDAQSSAVEKHRVYKYNSPYETMFPEFKLPYYAKKTIPYDDNIPVNQQVCFVHGMLNRCCLCSLDVRRRSSHINILVFFIAAIQLEKPEEVLLVAVSVSRCTAAVMARQYPAFFQS